MREEHLVASWWIDPPPRNTKVVPEIKEFHSEDEAIEEARRKKKQADPKKGIPENRVVVAKVIEEL